VVRLAHRGHPDAVTFALSYNAYERDGDFDAGTVRGDAVPYGTGPSGHDGRPRRAMHARPGQQRRECVTGGDGSSYGERPFVEKLCKRRDRRSRRGFDRQGEPAG
jgi:hypothetical protein